MLEQRPGQGAPLTMRSNKEKLVLEFYKYCWGLSPVSRKSSIHRDKFLGSLRDGSPEVTCMKDISREDLTSYIRSAYEGTRTADLQSKVWEFIIKRRRKDEEVTTPDIYEDEKFSNYSRNQIYTAVDNLVEKVGAVEKNKPSGGDQVFVHDRLDTLHFTFGEGTQEKLEKDLKQLIQHCREDSEVLEQVSDSLSVEAEINAVREELFWREHEDVDLFPAIHKFDRAVMNLERSDIDVDARNYGRMGWRGVANRLDFIQNTAEEALS